MALWDLKGKFLDLPLYQLLGGKTHDKLRAYASTLFADTPEETAARGAGKRETWQAKHTLGVENDKAPLQDLHPKASWSDEYARAEALGDGRLIFLARSDHSWR